MSTSPFLPAFATFPALLLIAGCLGTQTRFTPTDLRECVWEMERALKNERLRAVLETKEISSRGEYALFSEFETLDERLMTMISQDTGMFREFLGIYREKYAFGPGNRISNALYASATKNGILHGYKVKFPVEELKRGFTTAISRSPDETIVDRFISGFENSLRKMNITDRVFLDDLSRMLVEDEHPGPIRDIIACAVGEHVHWAGFLDDEYGELPEYPLTRQTVERLVAFLKAAKDHKTLHFRCLLNDLARGYYEYPAVRETVLDFIENRSEDPEERELLFDICAGREDHGFTLVAARILLDDGECISLRKRAAWHHIAGYGRRGSLDLRPAVEKARTLERNPFIRKMLGG